MSWDNSDCGTCINLDTCICDTCTNNEALHLGDRYERATPEMIAEREAKERKMIEDSLCQEVVQLELEPRFIETFNKCKRFSSNDKPKYVPVEARKRSLVSSNTYALCELLYCDVPSELQGKNIVKIEGNKVFLAVRMPYTVPDTPLKVLPDDIGRFFKHNYTMPKLELDKITERVGDNRTGEPLVELKIEDNHIFLRADLYDKAVSILNGIHTVGYTDEYSVVVFIALSGRIAIGPQVKCNE